MQKNYDMLILASISYIDAAIGIFGDELKSTRVGQKTHYCDLGDHGWLWVISEFGETTLLKCVKKALS